MISPDLFVELLIIVLILLISFFGGRKLTVIEDHMASVAATVESMNKAVTKIQELVTALANATGAAEIAALNDQIAAQTAALNTAREALNGVVG